jgi:glucose-1-phosphate thymidylyltransferase
MTEKAVILARGLGTRMQKAPAGAELEDERRRLAEKGLKALMPLNGRPFMDYVVDGLLRAGLRRVCFVIAPDADLMREQAARIEKAAGVRIECAVQERPLGTADAVLAAESFVGTDSFLMCNGDNLYPDEALSRLAGLDDQQCWLAAFCRDGLVRHGNISAQRVKDFAVVTASEDGRLLGIVEKPQHPERYMRDGRLWVSMNLYRFTPCIFEACRRVPPSPERGELELTAAVAGLLQESPGRFRVAFCDGGVFDLTSRADIPTAEAALRGRRLCF